MVHYRDDATVGGSLRVGQTLATHLDPGRVEVHLVFAYGGPGPVSQRARVPCHFLRAHGPRQLGAWRRARGTMHRLSPDLLHFMDPVIWLHLALCRTRYRRILHVHGRPATALADGRGSLFDRIAGRALARAADGQVCITHGARQALIQLGWGRPERTWTVHNGIDCEYFGDLPPRHVARTQLRLPKDARVLGMVCRLDRYKGCGDALRILRRLHPSWHLMFCGDGPFRAELDALAGAEQVRHRVHFSGVLDDVRPAFAAMDALLFLSRYEPFGLVLGEAMAAGVPVFGLGSDGEYREPEYPLVTTETALLVERRRPNDYHVQEASEVLDELTRWIQNYGLHPERYRAMVERARAWVREHFHARDQAESVARVYETILGLSHPPAGRLL